MCNLPNPSAGAPIPGGRPPTRSGPSRRAPPPRPPYGRAPGWPGARGVPRRGDRGLAFTARPSTAHRPVRPRRRR